MAPASNCAPVQVRKIGNAAERRLGAVSMINLLTSGKLELSPRRGWKFLHNPACRFIRLSEDYRAAPSDVPVRIVHRKGWDCVPTDPIPSQCPRLALSLLGAMSEAGRRSFLNRNGVWTAAARLPDVTIAYEALMVRI